MAHSFISQYEDTDYKVANCSHCKDASLWRRISVELSDGSKIKVSGEMLFPDFGLAPPVEEDMPEAVARDYREAASIFSKSPRAAAALLRLALQKLCQDLGEDGKNINDDIRSLAAKGALPSKVIQVADTVRITGNNAVHPGEMSEEDFDYVASKMFNLINFIVRQAITEPKELDELYFRTPEGPRRSAEDRDRKAKSQDGTKSD